MDQRQSGITEFVGVEYPQSEIEKYGYSTLAEKVSELDQQQIHVGKTDVDKIVDGASSAVTRRHAKRLIDHFGDYETVREVAHKGTDEDGHDELVAIPWISTQVAVAIRQSLAGDSE